MIKDVRSVGIYVQDQQRALEFYRDTLGFEVLQDHPMGEGSDAPRWLEVRPKGADTILVLFTPEGQEDRIGTFSNVIFTCDDVRTTYEELSARGVEFPDEPRLEFWGWWAVFNDPDGNSYGLSQPEQ
jgi:catechol 2,3-dioxygenase-like lactoylglutathione lyase family enzyme